MIDTHAHYNLDPLYPTWETYWEEAQRTGITTSIVVGTDEQSNNRAIELAKYNSHFFAAVGIHPEGAEHKENNTLQCMKVDRLLSSSSRIVAIGECGLDYYRLSPSQENERHKEHQKDLFIQQIELAQHHNLPLMIHCRDAYDDMLTILRKHKPRFVLHCMSGDLAYLQEALALGGYISFAGNITYPKATVIQELAQHTPLDRILLETDAPYLAPQTHRGEICHPAYIANTYAYTAQLLKITSQKLVQHVTENAHACFPQMVHDKQGKTL